ncbi:alpha carbonic anhydrase 4-like [Andrographis paniculata]|uniref:alpha carbonic anhydrase 4-like n=1 Tax=Andrographis paniculata TaxID=175694 RepID=UPI0021E7A0B7|nr:alpha carbonic anhydrase 4-like [Andrographis paniculata]
MGFDKISFTLIFFDCLLLTAFHFSAKANDKLREGLRIKADYSSYSYDFKSEDGPNNWGNLNPQWKNCKTGEKQSPIAISHRHVSLSVLHGDLKIKYKPAKAVIKKGSHLVEVEWKGDAGGIVINGIKYKLVQCHWHTPSEHTVNRFRGAAELHVVHKNDAGDAAVIAILYAIGPPDPFLGLVLPHLASNASAPDLGVLNPFWINLRDRLYYRYIGSFTTPPCSENVTWTVFKFVRTISRQQIYALRTSVKDGKLGTARPIQAMNGRTVYYIFDEPRPSI